MSETRTPPEAHRASGPDPAPSRSSTAAVSPDADGTVRFGAGAATSQNLTRRGRVRKWDRVPPPHDWRWYVGNLGKTLITIGLLMFGFVAYQLYGTGIETAAAQNELEDDFAAQLAEFGVDETFSDGDSTTSIGGTDGGEPTDGSSVSGDVAVVPGSGEDGVGGADSGAVAGDTGEPAAVEAVPVSEQNIPVDLADGDALARIQIDRIGVDAIVVAGVETGDLKKGPGHFPDTPLPGQLGNAAIAGHRTTYGQPFRDVDQLRNGDEIVVTTLNGVFVYRVTGQQIVEPSEYEVVATTNPDVANLTLTSCHPVFTARQRIVIFSELDRTESAPVGQPVINYGRPEEPTPVTEIPGDPDLPTDAPAPDAPRVGVPEPVIDPNGETVGDATDPDGDVVDGGVVSGGSFGDREPSNDADQLGTAPVNAGIADAFSESWFSDPAANPQVGLWGLVLGAIAIAAYLVSRRFKRDLLGLSLGVIPFTLALYFFFQNVNRLLPPNL